MTLVDLEDVLVLSGVALLSAGLWLVAVPLALIVVGVLLLLAGLWHRIARKR